MASVARGQQPLDLPCVHPSVPYPLFRAGGGKQLHSDTAQAAHDPSRPEAEVPVLVRVWQGVSPASVWMRQGWAQGPQSLCRYDTGAAPGLGTGVLRLPAGPALARPVSH